MAAIFQTRDRRMLNKAKAVLDAIVARDVKAADTETKTTAISTRELMFDTTDEVLFPQLTAVRNRIQALLNMET